MITICEFTDAVRAGLARSLLEENHIHAVLADENASAWTAARFLVPIRLQVPEAQENQARRLLQDFEDGQNINK